MAEAKAKAQSEKKSEETKQDQPQGEKSGSGLDFTEEQIAFIQNKIVGPVLKETLAESQKKWDSEKQLLTKRVEELHGVLDMDEDRREILGSQDDLEAFLVESRGKSEAQAKATTKRLFDALKPSEKPGQGFDIKRFLPKSEGSSEEQPKGEKPVARSPAPPGGIGLGRREDIRFDAKGGHVKALKEIVEEQTAEADRKRGFR